MSSFFGHIDVIDEPIEGFFHNRQDHFGVFDKFFEPLADGQGNEAMHEAPDGKADEARIAFCQVAFFHTLVDGTFQPVQRGIAGFPGAIGRSQLLHGLAENEHQVIIFRILHAKLQIVLAHFMQPDEGILDRRQGPVEFLHLLETDIVETGKDLVLVFKVEVYGSRAVFDKIGDTPDRNVFEPFFYKELHGRIQDLFPDLQLLFFFTLRDSHVFKY